MTIRDLAPSGVRSATSGVDSTAAVIAFSTSVDGVATRAVLDPERRDDSRGRMPQRLLPTGR